MTTGGAADLKRRVAVIAHARTGTHYLRGLLSTHPDAHFYGELLYPSFFEDGFYERWRRAVADDPEALILFRSVASILDELMHELAARRREAVVGFDLKIPALEQNPCLHKSVLEGDMDVIHLVRSNTLRAVISERIMYRRIERGDEEVHRRYTPPRVTTPVKPGALLSKLRWRVALDERIREIYAPLGSRYRRITYESFENDRDIRNALSPVFVWLGLDPAKATFRPQLERQNPARLRELVENFDELAVALRGTPFEWQLAG